MSWKILQTVIAGLWKYGPAIAAFIEFLQVRHQESGDDQVATDFERGFRVLTQTKSPKALRDAIGSRCGPDGCMFP
jgi:hypothetical protein